MTVRLNKLEDGRSLEVHVIGKLTRADYHQFVPETENLIWQYGRLNILLRLHAFQGWSTGALWEDIKFDVKHFHDVGRLAIVGDSVWEQGMAVFCKPFTAATVRYFDVSHEAEAREWVQESEQPAHQS